MNEFMEIFKELNKAGVKYLVVGGVAVSLHGYPRFTGDLDILLILDDKNLKKVDAVMKNINYSERLPVSVLQMKDIEQVKKWIQGKNLKAYTFNPPYGSLLQVDVILEESLKFEKFFKQKIVKNSEGIKIPVVSMDDLINMKKKAGRTKDKTDLLALKTLKNL